MNPLFYLERKKHYKERRTTETDPFMIGLIDRQLVLLDQYLIIHDRTYEGSI